MRTKEWRSLWQTLRIDTRKTCRASSTWTTSALTATSVGRRPQRILRAATTGVIPSFSSSRTRPKRRSSAGRRWKAARSKRLGTTAKAECDRSRTMNSAVKPTQRTDEPEAPTRASVPERFRRLKWNEVVWHGDFVADKEPGL